MYSGKLYRKVIYVGHIVVPFITSTVSTDNFKKMSNLVSREN